MPESTSQSMGSELRFEHLRASWDRLREWDKDHQLWSDAGLVTILLVVCLAFPAKFTMGGLEWVAFQVGLIVPLVWRRRAPSTVFVFIATLAFVQWLVAVPLPADVALLVSLFTLAVHATPTRAFAAAVIVEIGAVMAAFRWAPAGDITKSLVFLTGLVAASLFIGLTLRTWRAYLDSLVEQTRRLEVERDQQARLASAAERSRIAREMHDVVAHNVSIMVTLAEGAKARIDSRPAEAKEVLTDVSATGRLALADMRQLLGVLRTDDLAPEREPQPRLSGLPTLIERVRSTGLAIEFDETGQKFDVPPGVGLTIYRIVQESLTNVLKHATTPSSAEVAIAFDAPFVDVRVRDDGGPVRGKNQGHGLGGMRERAAFCGGTLSAGPQQGGGWEVAARVRVDQ